MRLLVFGDTHIKGAGRELSYEDLSLPEGTDGIVHTGDLVHDTSAANTAAGREFLEALVDLGVPVFTVPGNHDPVEEQRQLTTGISNASILHNDTVEIGGVTVVGQGCEQFDQGPEVDIRDFESLDPTKAPNRRFAADHCASRLEDALYDYATGDTSIGELEERLEIRRHERSNFRTQVEEFQDKFETLSSLLTPANERTVFVSHVPPYGTELDRHHAIGERESDLAGLHVGSLAQKVTLRSQRPHVALSGHSHRESYETLTDNQPLVHLLNSGFQGIVTVDIDLETGGFGFERY